MLCACLVLGYGKRVRLGSPLYQIRSLIAQRFLVSESAYLPDLIDSMCYILLNMSELLAYLTVKVGGLNWKIVRL